MRCFMVFGGLHWIQVFVFSFNHFYFQPPLPGCLSRKSRNFRPRTLNHDELQFRVLLTESPRYWSVDQAYPAKPSSNCLLSIRGPGMRRA